MFPLLGRAGRRTAVLKSCQLAVASSRAAWLGSCLCAQSTAETKLKGLTSSKALPAWEKYTMSKMCHTLGLKGTLDSIIMEIFNSVVQPSLLFTVEMQLLCTGFFWQNWWYQNDLLHRQTGWGESFQRRVTEIVVLVSGLHNGARYNRYEAQTTMRREMEYMHLKY